MQSSVPSAIGARHTAIRYLQMHECIEKLKRNMREEHVLKLDWISTLFKHVRSGLHCAAAECIFFPCKVDVFDTNRQMCLLPQKLLADKFLHT